MNDTKCHRFQYTSQLTGVSVDEVWARVGRWAGVNYELGPLIKMTYPTRFPCIEDIPADGKSHFTSTVLALGFLPVERHKFSLVACEAPRFFDEQSSNLNMRVWTHKRTLTANDRGVAVTDICSFEPRFRWMAGLLLQIYQLIFERRHRRLRQYFDR